MHGLRQILLKNLVRCNTKTRRQQKRLTISLIAMLAIATIVIYACGGLQNKFQRFLILTDF